VSSAGRRVFADVKEDILTTGSPHVRFVRGARKLPGRRHPGKVRERVERARNSGPLDCVGPSPIALRLTREGLDGLRALGADDYALGA
jgi:hypothetical protein